MNQGTTTADFEELTALLHDLLHHTETADTIDRDMLSDALYKLLQGLILAEHIDRQAAYFHKECMDLIEQSSQLLREKHLLHIKIQALEKAMFPRIETVIHGQTGHA